MRRTGWCDPTRALQPPSSCSATACRTSSEGTLVFPTYLTSISTTTYTDDQSATFGSTASAQLRYIAGTAFRMTPSSDGVVFQVGVPSGNQFDTVFLVGGGTDGLTINEGASTLVWTGGTASINNAGTGATNIGVGSTGAISIGDGSSGNWSVDGTGTGTINADTSIAMTVSAGTIGIAATGGDITVDSVSKSVIIRGTEEAGDAVVIHADGTVGGVDITSGTGDIVLVSTDDISLTVNTTTTDNLIFTNTPGTAENAIDFDATAGGMDFDFATGKNFAVTGGQFIFTSNQNVASAFSVITDTGSLETITLSNVQGTDDASVFLSSTLGGITLNAAAGSVDIEAVGGGDGDIGISAGDDMTVTVVGDLTYVVTGAMVLPNDILLRAVVDINTAEVLDLATNPFEILPSPAGTDLTYEFVSAIISLNYNSTAYVEQSAPDDLVFRYTNGSGALLSVLVDATGFATATGDVVVFVAPVADIVAGTTGYVAIAEASATDQSIVLDNTGDEWITGNSPIRVIIYYRIHTTAELGL